MVATEVMVVVDAVMVAGPIVGQDQGVMEATMTTAVTTEIEVKKKERRHLNLTLQENNMLMHMIQ